MTRLTDPDVVITRSHRKAIPGLREAVLRTDVAVSPELAPAPHRLSKLWLLIPLAAFMATGAVLYGLYRLRVAELAPDITVFEVKPMSYPVTLVAKGEIKAETNTEVRCEVEGTSTIVWLIEEGTQVKKGDLLVELTNQGSNTGSLDDRIKKQKIDVANAKADLENAEKNYLIQLDLNESNKRKAKLAVELAELNLKKYIEGDAEEARQTAKLNVREAEAVRNRTKAEVKTNEELIARGYITRSEYEDGLFLALKAELQLQKAELAEKILGEYTEKVQRRTKESEVEEARKDLARAIKSAEAEAARYLATRDAKRAQYEIELDKLDKLERQRENLKILAPSAGMAVYHRSERHWDPQQITVGATVHERQTLIDLPDPSVMLAEIKVNEARMDKLKLGLPATVDVEGISDERFTGKITKIGVLADAQHRWLNPNLKEFTNEITLDQTHPDLKPGMSAKVEILVTQLDDVLAVPVQCVFSKGGHSFVFLVNGDTRYQEVKLDLSSTEYVHVLEGVKAGDKVSLVITDDMKRLLPSDLGLNGNDKPADPWMLMPRAEQGDRTARPKAGSPKPGGQPGGKGKAESPPAPRRG